VPEVTGAGAWLVIASLAVVVGLGAASILAGFRGEHLEDTPLGRHRATSLLVGMGYLGLVALVVFAIANSRT
jgi:hypothetical protein